MISEKSFWVREVNAEAVVEMGAPKVRRERLIQILKIFSLMFFIDGSRL